MRILADCSVLIEVLRDDSTVPTFREAVGDGEVVLSRGTPLELLQGCKDEAEWEGALLLHRDRDFEVIAEVRPLQESRLAV